MIRSMHVRCRFVGWMPRTAHRRRPTVRTGFLCWTNAITIRNRLGSWRSDHTNIMHGWRTFFKHLQSVDTRIASLNRMWTVGNYNFILCCMASCLKTKCGNFQYLNLKFLKALWNYENFEKIRFLNFEIFETIWIFGKIWFFLFWNIHFFK